MASDEVERRIEAARVEGERVKATKEFMESLTKDTELVKPVYSPEAFVFRSKYTGAALRGELVKTNCTHPIETITQYVDEDPTIGRRGRAVNLFECGVCHTPLWWVDPWGNQVSDY